MSRRLLTRKRMKQIQFEKDFREIALGEGSVPITDDLINELVKIGKWNENQLKEYQKAGCVYHPRRQSIFYPPEFGSSEDF
jgi:hypothetical protein